MKISKTKKYFSIMAVTILSGACSMPRANSSVKANSRVQHALVNRDTPIAQLPKGAIIEIKHELPLISKTKTAVIEDNRVVFFNETPTATVFVKGSKTKIGKGLLIIKSVTPSAQGDSDINKIILEPNDLGVESIELRRFLYVSTLNENGTGQYLSIRTEITGTEMSDLLSRSATGLMYISEIDSSWTPFSYRLAKSQDPDEQSLREIFQLSTNKKLEIYTDGEMSDFWTYYTDESIHGKEVANRYATLRALMRSNLESVRVYKTGSKVGKNFKIYLLGQTRDKTLVGLKATSTET